MGAGRHIQIIEHEVLTRFTGATLAVVFDKLNEVTVRRLLNDEAYRDESTRSRSTELQSMAALLKNAADNDLHVEPFPLPVGDIFDAIDDGLIRDQFPRYPGHEQARNAFDGLPKGRPKRKQFYENEYGVPDRVQTYTELGRLMRDCDRIPDVLRELANNVERLAVTIE